MKELWLFGQLDTMGESDIVEQTERDARVVTDMVKDLVRQQNGAAPALDANGDVEMAAPAPADAPATTAE